MAKKWSKYGEICINYEKSTNKGFACEYDSISFAKPAIYRVCMKGETIFRFGGSDPDGTLSIGKASNLDLRFNNFRSGVEKATGHSEANLLHYIFWKSDAVSDLIEKTIVFYYKSTLKSQIDKEERDHIISYIKKFGEPPVLNCAIPRRYDSW